MGECAGYAKGSGDDCAPECDLGKRKVEISDLAILIKQGPDDNEFFLK